MSSISNGEAGSSVRSKLNTALAAVPIVQQLTSGADPVVINPDADIVQWTTGGTKGTELATLAIPSDPTVRLGHTMTIAFNLTAGDSPKLDATNIANPSSTPIDFVADTVDQQFFIEMVLQRQGSGVYTWFVKTPIFAGTVNTQQLETYSAVSGAKTHNSGPLTVGGVATFSSTMMAPGLPNADPHVAGELYTSSGTVKVSAG